MTLVNYTFVVDRSCSVAFNRFVRERLMPRLLDDGFTDIRLLALPREAAQEGTRGYALQFHADVAPAELPLLAELLAAHPSGAIAYFTTAMEILHRL